MSFEGGTEFEALIGYLRDTRGVDFTGYKRASLIRRVAKRAQELKIDGFAAYYDYLQVDGDEFPILFDRILINVTEFFRDPQSWDYLGQHILPEILAKNAPIRVWSTGTASGEEAYSAAMLLCEALGPDQFLRRVKIYATDIDDEALNKARGGYLPKDMESLDENAEAQGRILARFHYALNDDGFLFLGRAEMLLTHSALFVPLDLKQRIFTKVGRSQLHEGLMLLAQAGSDEATNHLARQMRVRELSAEGAPYAQLLIDALGVLVGANQVARRLFDIARTSRQLTASPCSSMFSSRR